MQTTLFTDESSKDATNPALNKAFVTCRFTPEVITELKPNEIFVFGSNWAGRHGKGAALQAVKWGAKYGVGLGLEGQTFALPTKNRKLETCELHEIHGAVIQLHICVQENKNKHFLITKIGCGLAGYGIAEIAPLFKNFIRFSNVSLPMEFVDVIKNGR